MFLRASYKAAEQSAFDHQTDADQLKTAIVQLNGHKVQTDHVHSMLRTYKNNSCTPAKYSFMFGESHHLRVVEVLVCGAPSFGTPLGTSQDFQNVSKGCLRSCVTHPF